MTDERSRGDVGAVVKYRKKPVVIEAVQYTGENVDEVLHFANQSSRDDECPGGDWPLWAQYNMPWKRMTTFPIGTMSEGGVDVAPGDWVIRGVHGEIYPCKPDIFESTYERVTTTPSDEE